MDKKAVGFIGTGNMGGALARAVFRSGRAGRILLANRTEAKARKIAEETGGEVCSGREAAALSDFLFIGIEPAGLEELAEEIRPELEKKNGRTVIVSMLAGKSLRAVEEAFGSFPVIRIMPNMPVSEGCGFSLYTVNGAVSDEEKEYFSLLIGPSGMTEETDEQTLVFGSGVTGCGPAFAALFIEALADGAVAVGLPRAKALRYAEGMLKGTAEMLLKAGMHPGALKDSVCSPGGSTIQGVRALEEGGLRHAVMNAVIAAFKKKF